MAPNCAQVLANLNHIYYLDISIYRIMCRYTLEVTPVFRPLLILYTTNKTTIQEDIHQVQIFQAHKFVLNYYADESVEVDVFVGDL